MTVSTIKSKPIYPGLTPDLNARRNIIVCDKAGAAAVAELLSRADCAFAERATIILADSLSATEAQTLSRDLAASYSRNSADSCRWNRASAATS